MSEWKSEIVQDVITMTGKLLYVPNKSTTIWYFKDLPVGTLFRFAPLANAVTENDPTVWKKTSSRKYTVANKKRLAYMLAYAIRNAKIYGYTVPKKVPDMKVGSLRATVVKVRMGK